MFVISCKYRKQMPYMSICFLYLYSLFPEQQSLQMLEYKTVLLQLLCEIKDILQNLLTCLHILHRRL